MKIAINRQHKSVLKKVNIKKRLFIQWMVLLLSFWPFLIEYLGDLPGIFRYTKYLADGILLLGLVLSFGKKRVRFSRRLLPFIEITVCFVVYTLVVYIFRYQSFFYYLWGLRNTARFLIAFFIFPTYLDEDDAIFWLRFMDILFWINTALSIYQFAVLEIRQDYLGGIFGIDGGSNGLTLSFLCIVVTQSLLKAFRGKERMWVCIAKCCSSLLVAAMAEMKLYFFLFMIILLLAALLEHFSWKTILLLGVCTVLIILCASVLTYWFENSENFLSFENFWVRATKRNYSSGNDLNRLAAIPVLSSKFLPTPVSQLFGLGLGNCDFSAFEICNTPFFVRYEYLHYLYFMAPTLFLETGAIGLGIYLSFFFACMFSYRKMRKQNKDKQFYCQMATIIAVLCPILAFYNATLRNDTAYMMFFVLSLPFFCKKGRTNSL